MKDLTRNITTTPSLLENEAVLEILKIIAFGSVFPTIYLLGKIFTQL